MGMLVLGRRRGRSIYIGRGITVTVLDIDTYGNVKLGIDAPRSIAVSRDDYTYETHLEFQDRRERDHRMDRRGTT